MLAKAAKSVSASASIGVAVSQRSPPETHTPRKGAVPMEYIIVILIIVLYTVIVIKKK